MTETTIGEMTPAEVAQAVLAGIEGERGAFSMNDWISFAGLSGRYVLRPEDNPMECGTTLCAAGWACHVTGWTIRSFERLTRGRSARGYTMSRVAAEALGLTEAEANYLFYCSEERAIQLLTKIAEGQPLNLW